MSSIQRILFLQLLNVIIGEDEIPEMSVELYLLDKLKARIQVARQIDSAQHKIKKENHEKNWLREAADAMEIEIDSDLGLRYITFIWHRHHVRILILFFSSEEESKGLPTKQKRKQTQAKTAALKAELKSLLAQPLVARGVSTKYITSGSRSIVDDFIAGDCTSFSRIVFGSHRYW